MEKNNGKIIAVVALVIAVVSLSVGFAAFSATLTIENISATATSATDTFATGVQYTGNQTVVCYEGDTSTELTETYAGGSATNQTWTGVNVPLTPTVREVTCKAEITNASTYLAKLRQISIADYVTCASTGSGDTAASNEAEVCATVTATVSIAGDSTTFTTSTAATPNKAAYTGASSTIAANNGTAVVSLKLAYSSSINAPDGDLAITVPTISLLYKTN